MNVLYIFLDEYTHAFLLPYILGVKFSGSELCVYSNLISNAKQFSKLIITIYSPTNSTCAIHPHQHVIIVSFFKLNYWVCRLSHCGFKFYFLVTDEVEHCFTYFLAIRIYFFLY